MLGSLGHTYDKNQVLAATLQVKERGLMAKGKKSLDRKRRKKNQRAKNNRHARHVARTSFDTSSGEVQRYSMPAMSDIECSPGFRAVAPGQAMQEYGKTLFTEFENQHGRPPEGMEEFQGILNLTMLFWNHALSIRNGDEQCEAFKNSLSENLASLLPKSSAEDLTRQMIERYDYLFPKEHDRRGSPYFVIRNEFTGSIAAPDKEASSVLPAKRASTPDESRFVSELVALDGMIRAGRDYEEYEKAAISANETGCRCFEAWLADKKLPASSVFVDVFHLFTTFLYQYEHAEARVTFYMFDEDMCWEFLNDFVLRKASIEPNDLMKVPAILKLVAVWLSEIEYIPSAEPWMELIKNQEEEFYSTIRDRFESRLE